MRRIILFLTGIMGLLGAIQALAQTPAPIPITGNLGAISGTGQPYAGVQILLQNCPSPVAITGYFGIVQQGYQIRATSSGLITGNIWPNDLIDCNGTTGNSQYSVTLMNSGTPSGTRQCYQVTSTQGIWNMNTQQPIACTAPPPNPQDAQYRNVNITGCFSVDGSACGGLVIPCTSVGAIQITNLATTGLSCDPTITINTTNHTIGVGALPTNHLTIGALGTATAWTLDTTTAATALASLGGCPENAGTINQLAYYAAAGCTLSGTGVLPAIITATTRSPGDNSTFPATTAYVALPGPINPTSVQIASGVAMTANQGNGIAVQHSTGATTTNDLVKFDANGNTVDSGFGIAGSVSSPSRSFGAVYQNTASVPMLVTISIQHGSSTECTETGYIGSSSAGSPAGLALIYGYASVTPTTGSPSSNSMTFMVPAQWYYGAATDVCSIQAWTEAIL